MANSPFTCKDCPDRYPGCHDKCEKYRKEKAEWDKTKAKLAENRELQAYICGTINKKRDTSAKKGKQYPKLKTYNQL